MGWKQLGVVLGSSVLFLLAGSAQAQDQPPPPPPTLPPPPPVPPPPPPPATVVVSHEDSTTDHERVSNGKHFAVGYFGLSNLPIGAGGTGGLTRGTVSAPVVGVRYWFNRTYGLDIGVGIGVTSGSTESVTNNSDNSVNQPNPFGFALHAGVPIALASAKHFTFEVVPEANLGFTSATLKGTGNNADTSLSGFHFDIGARVGAEIQFGFIGIPQLALEGSVGLYLTRETFKASQDPNSTSTGAWTFGTTVGADPWAMFVNQISALYYF